MEWVIKCFYFFNNILQVFINQFKGIKDNKKLLLINFVNCKKYDFVLIIGGGLSVVRNVKVVEVFFQKYLEIIVIYVSFCNVLSYVEIEND